MARPTEGRAIAPSHGQGCWTAGLDSCHQYDVNSVMLVQRSRVVQITDLAGILQDPLCAAGSCLQPGADPGVSTCTGIAGLDRHLTPGSIYPHAKHGSNVPASTPNATL